MLLMNKCVGTIAYLGGIPALLEEFVHSWTQLIAWNHEYLCGSGEYVHYDRAKVSVHDVARNILAESMRGDWLLQLDTDHAFEPDIAARLLRIADQTGADVVTGLYLQRFAPFAPVAYRQTEVGLSQIGNWDRTLPAIEVDSAGGGCLLVKRAVFERLRDETGEQPFERIKGLGEDHSFFLRCKKLGIRTVCATQVECHHLHVKALTVDDYDPASMSLEEPVAAAGYR
jgi:hypothetical protein